MLGTSAIARLLGLGSPVAAALAIYALFRFLDKKASGEAKWAVTTWIKSEKYKNIDLSQMVLSAFDVVYDAPLNRMRALVRSAMLSVLALCIYALIVQQSRYSMFDSISPRIGEIVLGPIIAADYISLFVIRTALRVSKRNFFIFSALALAGAIVILECVMLLLSVVLVAIIGPGMDGRPALDNVAELLGHHLQNLFTSKFNIEASIPALFVYVWIPLLLVGATINKLIASFFKAAKSAQWFIKRGTEHPFEAIGMTTGAVVFVAVASWQAIGVIVGR